MKRHGTRYTYNAGCRCDACRRAATAAVWRYRAARAPLAPDDPRHGTTNGYNNLNCRCDACREAWRIAHHDYMHAHPEQQAKAALRERARYRGRAA